MSFLIFVVDPSCYETSDFRGEWLDIENLALEEIHEKIQVLLNKWGATDWCIHDYEGFPFQTFGDNPKIEDLVTYLSACLEHGEQVVNAFLNFQSLNDIEFLPLYYIGAYESEKDFERDCLLKSGAINRSVTYFYTGKYQYFRYL